MNDRDALAALLLPFVGLGVHTDEECDNARQAAECVIAAGWRPIPTFDTETQRNAAMALLTAGQRPVCIVGTRLCRWDWNPDAGADEWVWIGNVNAEGDE